MKALALIRRAWSRRMTLTVEEAGTLLGVSKSTAYEMVRRGQLPTIQVSKCLRVLAHRVEEEFGPIPWETLEDDDKALGGSESPSSSREEVVDSPPSEGST